MAKRFGWPLAVAIMLAGCDTGIDLGGGLDGFNLRGPDSGRQTAPRPEADARGVISYPNYQVVVARRGDLVEDVAARIGVNADALARHNGLASDSPLRDGEILALPTRVAASGTQGGIDIETIASAAIDKADTRTSTPTTTTTGATGIEPLRHKVERGETAYSIARLYSVSVTALAEWNSLGPDLAVRQGQTLLIPVVLNREDTVAGTSRPGQGSATPAPPSASKPLPADVKTPNKPASPNLAGTTGDRTFLAPVAGKIVKDYSGKSGGNEGIDIAADAGTSVKAAEDGEVALVSRSVGASTIVLLRHADNIYTVYSNVTDVTLAKGDKVRRGQSIGVVAKGNPSVLHFEVRRGTQSVDPKPFL
jgi:lipoprotein NlpD